MAVVLVATGLFVYLRLTAELDDSIDDGLRSRADEVSALIRQSGSGLRQPRARGSSEQEESFAQILDSRRAGGRHLVPERRTGPLFTPQRSPARARDTLVVSHDSVPGVEERRGPSARHAGACAGPRADRRRRHDPGGPQRGARQPPDPAADRRAGRAPARLAGRLRGGGRSRCGRSSGCAGGRRRSPRPSRASGSRSRPPTTRSAGSVTR